MWSSVTSCYEGTLTTRLPHNPGIYKSFDKSWNPYKTHLQAKSFQVSEIITFDTLSIW